MSQDKSLPTWKRKKSEVERTIKSISQQRENTLYLYHTSKKSPAGKQLCALLEMETTELQRAQQELRMINNRIISLEKEQQQYGIFKAAGILGLLIFSILMGTMLIKEYSLGTNLIAGDSITGAIVSLPEPTEGDDSTEVIEVPTPPLDESNKEETIEIPPPDPIENEEQEQTDPSDEVEHQINIPDLPLESPPLESQPELNTTPTVNSTIINQSINDTADEKVIQLYPTLNPLESLQQNTFRSTLGIQGGTANSAVVNARQHMTPFQPGTKQASGNSYTANIGFFKVNTSIASTSVSDTTVPNVTNMTPLLNSRFNFSTPIEISANVTDSSGVSAVNISILLPNGSITPLVLSATVLTAKYNTSYIIPNLTGLYNITFGANDTLNFINSTEFTNFTAVNVAPVVYWVAPVHSQSITEGGIAQIINISFNVSDVNGKEDIDNSSAQIRISLPGETDRINSSCVSSASTSATIQFNCTVGIWHFDGAGSWTINVSVRDKSSIYAENLSTTFELLSTTAMTMSPNTLTWPTLELGQTNRTSNNDPFIINNTGNKNINVGGVAVTAYDLQGTSVTTDFIKAQNFSIYPVNNITNAECNGTQMINNTAQVISVANITRGNNTINYYNGTSGQEELFVCLRFVPLGITRQSYDTSGQHSGVWSIAVS